MPLTVDLDVHELAETASGLQLLGRGSTTASLRPWLRWARREVKLAGLTLPTAWPLLIPSGRTWPEFLVPSPHRPEPTIDDELLRMRATRATQVRSSIGRVFGPNPPEPVARVTRSPASNLRAIAAELRAAHDVLIAPHWDRLHAVLAADIAYRARQLAIGGAERLFADLHADLSWDAGRLTLRRGRALGGSDRKIVLGERGLVLVPSVLTEDQVRIKLTTSTQTTLRYPARGIAALWTAGLYEPRSTVVELLGRPRARILASVRSPATTGAMARALGVTPSAVSQHLAVLRDGGLVCSERSGRNVLHLATDLGLALLDPR